MDLDHVPQHARAGLLAMNAGKPLASIDRATLAKDLANRYLDGAELADLAIELGVSRARLYQILVTDPDAWKDAQSAKALQAFEETLEALHTAPDGLELARARETHRSAQWQLEKLLRRLYGEDKSAIILNAAGNVQIQVVSFADVVATPGIESQGQIIDSTEQS